MYWIHISDIHFNFDGYDTEKMRMELLEYISQENFENLDAIFLTGDLRFAPKKEFKQETKDYIDSLLDSFNPKVPIYISAGNHDLDRSDSRNNMIKGIRKKYKASIGTIDQVDLDLLNTPFKSFNSFIEDSEGKIVKNNNPHRYVNTKKANIICLNTSILSGFSSEDEYGQLIIGIKFLEECLKKTDKNKPTIVYGHHSLESLRYDEHIRVIELLKNYNVHVYLCGHNHIFKINNISYDNNYNLFELFAGNLYTEESNSQCGFLEVKLSENELMIKCHEWDFGNRKWHVSNSYSGEDGLIKRLPIVKKDEIVLPKIKTANCNSKLKQFLSL